MTKPKYIQFIDESVKANKDILEKNELIQYMIGDTPGIDGDKAERDHLSPTQAYELSVYSTLLQVQMSLHELHKEGSTKPIRMQQPEDTDDSALMELLEKILPNAATISKSGNAIVMKGKASSKQELIDTFEEALKKLKEDN